MTAARNPYTQFRDEISPILQREFQRFKEPIRVLEAGGGSATFLSEYSQRFHFTTVDISPEQLMKNTYASEKLLGDLQYFDYAGRRFDLIVCYDILEHLKEPASALHNLVGALEPGGLMVVKGPIPQSMQGLVTKLTPHWLHVCFYRWMWQHSNAGQPGYAPFRTEHSSAARPEAIRSNLLAAGLTELHYLEFATHSASLQRRSRWLHALFKAAASLLQLVTADHYGGTNSDFVLICCRHEGEVTPSGRIPQPRLSNSSTGISS